MAISVKQYIDLEKEHREQWEKESLLVENEIDEALIAAISSNLVPNPKNPKFVLRYQFKEKVSAIVKEMMKIKYGQLGWTIKENIDFKETNYHGYFDMYQS